MKDDIKILIEQFVANLRAGNRSDAHTCFNNLLEQMIATQIKEKEQKLFESRDF